ncbi:sensor histidine kinase [bacterium BMS3Abin03]|jgi:signal transduction histidine kinase|nr:sensor histidine kinase [bacterium BMS3Abin03]MCG6961289.1 sensor histidine kinase [bacterium BMS3Abin03]
MHKIVLIILQETQKLKDFEDLIFYLYNPVLISALIFFILLLLLYFSYKYIYNPLILRYKSEKEKFELKTARLLALFSELDPNPIIRINISGKVAGLNKAAKERFKNIEIDSSKIKVLLKDVDFNLKKAIKNNESLVLIQEINDKTYEINFHGISYLRMAQLYFLDVSERKEYERQMNKYQKLLRDASAQLNEVLETDRKKISGLLHDSIGQNLLLIRMNIMNYKKNNNNGFDENEISRTIELLDSAILEVKEVARNLRPQNIEELGLTTVLKMMCSNVSRETGIKANVQIAEVDSELDRELENCIFRVTQEALNNIMRHSKASKFAVDLSTQDEVITLVVSDDGIGFKPKQLMNDKYFSDGIGIMNMQERVERVNGSFHIDSDFNTGTTIITQFTIRQQLDETKSEDKSSDR